MENLNARLEDFDAKLVAWAGRVALPFARFSLFIIYAYFGAIKIFSTQGAANPLVMAVVDRVFGGISVPGFLVAFGIFEIIVGILFLIPNLNRLGVFLLILHMIATIMPLFLLPQFTWAAPFVPTIEGQYILKNILIISAGIFILSSLKPLKEDRNV